MAYVLKDVCSCLYQSGSNSGDLSTQWVKLPWNKKNQWRYVNPMGEITLE